MNFLHLSVFNLLNTKHAQWVVVFSVLKPTTLSSLTLVISCPNRPRQLISQVYIVQVVPVESRSFCLQRTFIPTSTYQKILNRNIECIIVKMREDGITNFDSIREKILYSPPCLLILTVHRQYLFYKFIKESTNTCYTYQDLPFIYLFYPVQDT